jgi:hypothetical protein
MTVRHCHRRRRNASMASSHGCVTETDAFREDATGNDTFTVAASGSASLWRAAIPSIKILIFSSLFLMKQFN